MTHCNSCGTYVEGGEPKDSTYCNFCQNSDGKIDEREKIKKGIAGWLKAWSPKELDDETALKRAELYMLSMPHWAEAKN